MRRDRRQDEGEMRTRRPAILAMMALTALGWGCGSAREDASRQGDSGSAPSGAPSHVYAEDGVIASAAPPQTAAPESLTDGNESYEPIVENEFKATRESGLSTFSVDVDTESHRPTALEASTPDLAKNSSNW